MSIEFYPKAGYFILIENIKTSLGTYYNATWGDLNMAHMRVYNRSATPYEYNLRLHIADYDGGPTLHTSDWFKFSNEVTGQQGEFWLGDIIFTFPEYPMTNQSEYFVSMETQNYNPDGISTYLSVWSDWIQPVGNADSAGARIAIGVKR